MAYWAIVVNKIEKRQKTGCLTNILHLPIPPHPKHTHPHPHRHHTHTHTNQHTQTNNGQKKIGTLSITDVQNSLKTNKKQKLVRKNE